MCAMQRIACLLFVLVLTGCATTQPIRQTLKIDVQVHALELEKTKGDATVGVAYLGSW
jgi:hypothetical protein